MSADEFLRIERWLYYRKVSVMTATCVLLSRQPQFNIRSLAKSSTVLKLLFNCLEAIFADNVSLLRKPFHNFKVPPVYFTALLDVSSNLVIMAL